MSIIKYYSYTKNLSDGNYRCLKCSNREKAQDQKIHWDIVKKIFTDKGYVLLSKASEYKNNKSQLRYICNKHREIGVQKTNYELLARNENNCHSCWYEATSGKTSNHWKGGLTSISQHIRDKIIVWKSDSMKSCNYKCVLTGDRFDNVHHLQGFNLILKQVIEEIGFELKDNVGDYTEDELEILVNHVIATHYKYPLGVCLRRDVHILFHSLYGAGDNTPDQFYEFRDRYNNGEFEEFLSCN